MSRARRGVGSRRLFGVIVGVVVGFVPGLFSVVGLSAPLAAQEPSTERAAESTSPARPLSFEDAVRTALEQSPGYLRELNAVRSSEYAERSSLGELLPSLSAGLSFDGYTSRTRTGFDEFGRPLEEAEFVQSTRSRASQGVNGRVTLFDLGSIRSYGAARAQTDAREWTVEYQAAVLRREVGQAYFEAVQRRELIAVEERALATARQQLAAIQELLRVAAKDPTDVLGAELTVARAEQSLNQARGEERKARLALKGTMGVPLEQSYEITTSFPAVFDPARLDVDGLIARALARSPRMAQQEASVVAAERSLSAARAARYPTLSGSYGWGRSASARDYEAWGQFDPPDQSWNFGVSVGLPLFNRLQTHASIGQAEMEARNARESQREVRLQLEQEVRAALIDLENAYTTVRLAERSAEIARARLDQGRERYRLGTIDYTALQDMINAVAAEERGVINANLTFATALLTLEEKLGAPVGG